MAYAEMGSPVREHMRLTLSVAAIHIGHTYNVSDEMKIDLCVVEVEISIRLESVLVAYAEMGRPVREHM